MGAVDIGDVAADTDIAVVWGGIAVDIVAPLESFLEVGELLEIVWFQQDLVEWEEGSECVRLSQRVVGG